jgi:hypothetical protein
MNLPASSDRRRAAKRLSSRLFLVALAPLVACASPLGCGSDATRAEPDPGEDAGAARAPLVVSTTFASFTPGAPVALPLGLPASDSTVVDGATVYFVGGLEPAADALTLGYSDPSITSSYDAIHGVLTIRGAASSATYVGAILPTVQFATTSTSLQPRMVSWSVGADVFNSPTSSYAYHWVSNATAAGADASTYCPTLAFYGASGYPAAPRSPEQQRLIDLAVAHGSGATGAALCTAASQGFVCQFGPPALTALTQISTGNALFVPDCTTVGNLDTCNLTNFCAVTATPSCQPDPCLSATTVAKCRATTYGCVWDARGFCLRQTCPVLGESDCSANPSCVWERTPNPAHCVPASCAAHTTSCECAAAPDCTWTSNGQCVGVSEASCAPTDYVVIVQNSGLYGASALAAEALRKWALGLRLDGESYGASGTGTEDRLAVFYATSTANGTFVNGVQASPQSYFTSNLLDVEAMFDWVVRQPANTAPMSTVYNVAKSATSSAGRKRVIVGLFDKVPTTTVSTASLGGNAIALVANPLPASVSTASYAAFASSPASSWVLPVTPDEAPTALSGLCKVGNVLHATWAPEDCSSIGSAADCATDASCEWDYAKKACVVSHCRAICDGTACNADPRCTAASGSCLGKVCAGTSPTCSETPTPSCLAGTPTPAASCSAPTCSWNGASSTCGPAACAADVTMCSCLSDPSGCTWSASAGCAKPCTPATTCPVGQNCGTAPDGCGGTIACGSCSAPQTCGGGGSANVCGCTPATTCPAGQNCGTAPNGCGGTIACGSCAGGTTCAANVCVAVAVDAGADGVGDALPSDAVADGSTASDADVGVDATGDVAADASGGTDADAAPIDATTDAAPIDATTDAAPIDATTDTASDAAADAVAFDGASSDAATDGATDAPADVSATDSALADDTSDAGSEAAAEDATSDAPAEGGGDDAAAADATTGGGGGEGGTQSGGCGCRATSRATDLGAIPFGIAVALLVRRRRRSTRVTRAKRVTRGSMR